MYKNETLLCDVLFLRMQILSDHSFFRLLPSPHFCLSLWLTFSSWALLRASRACQHYLLSSRCVSRCVRIRASFLGTSTRCRYQSTLHHMHRFAPIFMQYLTNMHCGTAHASQKRGSSDSLGVPMGYASGAELMPQPSPTNGGFSYLMSSPSLAMHGIPPRMPPSMPPPMVPYGQAPFRPAPGSQLE